MIGFDPMESLTDCLSINVILQSNLFVFLYLTIDLAPSALFLFCAVCHAIFPLKSRSAGLVSTAHLITLYEKYWHCRGPCGMTHLWKPQIDLLRSVNSKRYLNHTSTRVTITAGSISLSLEDLACQCSSCVIAKKSLGNSFACIQCVDQPLHRCCRPQLFNIKNQPANLVSDQLLHGVVYSQ